jgi:hypothetical protein
MANKTKRITAERSNILSVKNFLSKNIPETLIALLQIIEVEEISPYQDKIPVIYMIFSPPASRV